MSEVTTVGLVGCGGWGRHILRDLVTLGCAVHVVARSEASIGRATEGGATSIVRDVNGLADVDGYVVAVPTLDHAAVVTELLVRGRPVFVEKPMATDVAAAGRLAVEPELFVMDKWRYHPGVAALRDLIASGRLGSPRLITTTRHNRFNPHGDVDAVWVLIPHDLAIVFELIGRLPPAIAAAGESDGMEASLIGVLGDDSVSAVVDVSSRTDEFRRRVRVVFEGGVAVLGGGYDEAIEILVTEHGAEPKAESIAISEDMPLLLELEAFVGHLRDGPPPRSSAAVGAMAVERIAELRALAGI